MVVPQPVVSVDAQCIYEELIYESSESTEALVLE
jgi:hypothetical protein